MPYTVIWLIPDRVIYAHCSGHIAEDELRENLQLITNMIDNSRFPHVHVISDTADMVTPLMAQNSLQFSQEVGRHERTGWVITIREKAPLIKMSTAFASSVDSSKARFFNTLEEAENFLKQADTSLYWGS